MATRKEKPIPGEMEWNPDPDKCLPEGVYGGPLSIEAHVSILIETGSEAGRELECDSTESPGSVVSINQRIRESR